MRGRNKCSQMLSAVGVGIGVLFSATSCGEPAAPAAPVAAPHVMEMAPSATPTFDTAKIEELLGAKGKWNAKEG
ncbi:MAG TPA: hypothetical protein VL860_01040, partial [Planctomycetota bacterium]|nr:hypothetical protein [Planctomycetota bacterium]